MTFEQVRSFIEKVQPGSFFRIEWEKEIPVKAAFAGIIPPIRKHSSITVRAGVDYDRMKSVITKRAEGVLPSTNQGLPKGTKWLEYPYYIENLNCTKKYLRVALTENNKATHRFTMGGAEVPMSDIAEFVPKSTIRSEYGDVLIITVDNITRLYKGDIYK